MSYSRNTIPRALGSSAVQDIAAAAPIFAAFIANPEATLATRGPAMEQAIQRHILDPIAQDILKKMAPVAIPAAIVLYGLVGASVYYSWKATNR